jgi:hypothetical protein
MGWPRTGIIRIGGDEESTNQPPVTPIQPGPLAPPPPPSPGSIIPVPDTIDNGLVNMINYSNMVVDYFKINLESTVTNIYGEAPEKWYYPPARVKCLIERSVITNTNDDFGVDSTQTLTITIPKQNLQVYNFLVEVGDIVSDRERYYEVNNVDSQFITIPGGGSSSNSSTGTTGQVILFILTCHLTRVTRLNLVETYQ